MSTPPGGSTCLGCRHEPGSRRFNPLGWREAPCRQDGIPRDPKGTPGNPLRRADYQIGRRMPCQCHLHWPMSRTCIISGADALVRSRPPSRLPFSARDLILREKSGTRASRADQGVRPTINAKSQLSANVSDIGMASCGRLAIGLPMRVCSRRGGLPIGRRMPFCPTFPGELKAPFSPATLPDGARSAGGPRRSGDRGRGIRAPPLPGRRPRNRATYALRKPAPRKRIPRAGNR